MGILARLCCRQPQRSKAYRDIQTDTGLEVSTEDATTTRTSGIQRKKATQSGDCSRGTLLADGRFHDPPRWIKGPRAARVTRFGSLGLPCGSLPAPNIIILRSLPVYAPISIGGDPSPLPPAWTTHWLTTMHHPNTSKNRPFLLGIRMIAYLYSHIISPSIKSPPFPPWRKKGAHYHHSHRDQPSSTLSHSEILRRPIYISEVPYPPSLFPATATLFLSLLFPLEIYLPRPVYHIHTRTATVVPLSRSPRHI